jgi:predicted amidohydrolase
MRTLKIFLIIVLIFPVQIYAKREVKVATFSVMPPRISLDTKPQKVVDFMIDFWKKKIEQVLPDKPDLIVLPEACDRPDGFSSNWSVEKAYYEVRGDQILNFLSKVADDNNCYIVYSYKHKVDDGSFRNSSVMIDRSGKVIGRYNKNFPTIGEMNRGVKAGKSTPVVECDFGRVGMLICFDLLFEEIREDYAVERPDMLVFSSRYHGGFMQSVWAYTTQSYFVGCVEDSPELLSQIYNPVGDVIASTTNYTDYVVATLNLDYEVVHLDNNWEKLDNLKAKYGSEVTIHDPGLVGVVLVMSNSNEVSSSQMLKEFGIKDWDHYYKSSVDYRNARLR